MIGVYFAEVDGLLKVGMSWNIDRRLKHLRARREIARYETKSAARALDLERKAITALSMFCVQGNEWHSLHTGSLGVVDSLVSDVSRWDRFPPAPKSKRERKRTRIVAIALTHSEFERAKKVADGRPLAVWIRTQAGIA